MTKMLFLVFIFTIPVAMWYELPMVVHMVAAYVGSYSVKEITVQWNYYRSRKVMTVSTVQLRL